MTDIKETKNAGINFPCGNLEEMLRMMRKCRENGNVDCEAILKKIMGKEFKNIDFDKMKKHFFDNDSKSFSFKEIIKKSSKR
jgi:hypothetical protein